MTRYELQHNINKEWQSTIFVLIEPKTLQGKIKYARDCNVLAKTYKYRLVKITETVVYPKRGKK